MIPPSAPTTMLETYAEVEELITQAIATLNARKKAS